MQLTPNAAGLLLRAFAEGTASLQQSDVQGYMPPLALENNPDLVEPTELLVDAGLVVLTKNPNPITWDTCPQLLLLTHKAVAWCSWYYYRQHWEHIQPWDGWGSVADMSVYLDLVVTREMTK